MSQGDEDNAHGGWEGRGSAPKLPSSDAVRVPPVLAILRLYELKGSLGPTCWSREKEFEPGVLIYVER